MPRALSNPEFAQFMTDNSNLINSMNYPDKVVVPWNGLSVLVFIGPNALIADDGTAYKDVYLSDVSDSPQLAALTGGAYQQQPITMLQALPEATKQVIAEDAAAAGALVNSVGQAGASALNAATSAIGQAAAGLTQPLVGQLSPILVAGLALAAIAFLPKK